MSVNLHSQAITPHNASPHGGFLFPDELEKERILIADDSVTVRKIFANHLSARYNCFEASSVPEALAQLSKTEFALVIADVIMPGLSGVELLRKIIESYPYTAVIMVSGVEQPQRALDAVRL